MSPPRRSPAAAVKRTSTHVPQRILAVGAHPDDVEIGCGGTLAKHRDAGDALMILTLSMGAQGGEAKRRARESQRAAQRLGATLQLCDFQDTAITEGATTIRAIESAIRAFKPTHVYTHTREDTHQDHRAVHAATIVAARQVPNVFCYQSPSSTVDFRPQRYVDVSAHIDDKLELIGMHQTQVSKRTNIQGDLIVATARYWGRYAGCVLAEPMSIVRQVA